MPRQSKPVARRQARSQNFALERSNVLLIDQLVIDRGDRVLPDEFFGRNLRAEITRARTHVAMRQLEPRTGEGIGELVRMLEKRREIFSYAGSTRRAISVVSIDGVRRFDGSCGSGTVSAPASPFGFH